VGSSLAGLLEGQQPRTLIVGKTAELQRLYPALAAALEQHEGIVFCGPWGSAGDNTDPVRALHDQIAAARAQRLWLVGGDGTINLVAATLLRFKLNLPCLLTPGGTANDLARTLRARHPRLVASSDLASSPERACPAAGVGLNRADATLTGSPASGVGLPRPPHDPTAGSQAPSSDAAATHASPETTLETLQVLPEDVIDVLQVQLDEDPVPRCCVNMLTLGTSARNTQFVTTEIKQRWGALAYLTQFWRTLTDLESVSIRLQVGEADARTIQPLLNLFVANGITCGGGYRVAPPALLDDGQMDIVLLREGTAAELAQLGASFLTGTHLNHTLVEHFTAEQLSIDCGATTPLTLDGEVAEAARIRIGLVPRFLRIRLVTR
jgi:diacylglycerol kinase family enzyme